MWLRLMIVAFFGNGLSPFGLKIITEHHLSGRYQYQYLASWYLSGTILLAAVLLKQKAWPSRWEIALGFLMGIASLLGQTGTVMALSRNVTGAVVFPLVLGGSVFFVTLGGRVLFKEKIGTYGILGVTLGIVALALLAIP